MSREEETTDPLFIACRFPVAHKNHNDYERRDQRAVTMEKQKRRGDVFQLAPRPAYQTRVAEQAWVADVSREFLRLIRE